MAGAGGQLYSRATASQRVYYEELEMLLDVGLLSDDTALVYNERGLAVYSMMSIALVREPSIFACLTHAAASVVRDHDADQKFAEALRLRAGVAKHTATNWIFPCTLTYANEMLKSEQSA